eukprot:scaffold3864_cov248-Pinguiococcus_pyrenoidosus.AAC.6
MLRKRKVAPDLQENVPNSAPTTPLSKLRVRKSRPVSFPFWTQCASGVPRVPTQVPTHFAQPLRRSQSAPEKAWVPPAEASQTPSRLSTLQAQIFAVLNNDSYGFFLGVVTLFSLFGDDMRLAAARPSADDGFFAVAAVILGLFFSDLCLNCFAWPGYPGSFNFYVDVLSTLATIPDVGWLWDLMVGTQNSLGERDLVRDSAASASTARASRILRVVRLLRLLRVAKLWLSRRTSIGRIRRRKVVPREQAERQRQQNAKNDPKQQGKGSKIEPSTVSKRLNESVTKNLMICVLTLVLVLPLFDGEVIFLTSNEWQAHGLAKLHYLAQDANATEGEFRGTLEQYLLHSGRLIYMEVCEPPSDCSRNFSQELQLYPWLSDLRFPPLKASGDFDYSKAPTLKENPLTKFTSSELFADAGDIEQDFRAVELIVRRESVCWDQNYIQDKTRDDCISVAVFDDSDSVRLVMAGRNVGSQVFRSTNASGPAHFQEAILSITKTFLVMVVVMAGVLLLHRDAQYLVVGPIERMVRRRLLLSDTLHASQASRDALSAGRHGQVAGRQSVEELARSGNEGQVVEEGLQDHLRERPLGEGAAEDWRTGHDRLRRGRSGNHQAQHQRNSRA